MTRLLLSGLLLLLAAPGCRAEPQPAAGQPASATLSPAGLELAPLAIQSGANVHRFVVEVARGAEDQARGLMFRQSLGPNEGMIFPFAMPRPASFWMKNTLMPLDMLFVRADGSIAFIAENVAPQSLEPVGVEEPVAAVLELAGGRSAQLGIKPGDRVSWGLEQQP